MQTKHILILIAAAILVFAGVFLFLNDRPATDPGIRDDEQEEQTSSVEDQVRTEVEKVLAQGTLPNPSLEMPKNIKLLSVNVDENQVTLNFSKEIVSNGRDAFEATFSLVANAVHPIIQGEGQDPRYPEMGFIILVDGKPVSDDMFTTGSNIVKPDAPGPFVADAVRNLMPKSLKVGQNTITAEVRGFMFFEAETQLRLYDGKKEIDIGKRPDGLPNTVLTAQGEWMTTGYVPISQVINIPAGVKGKILTIRFIANDPSDNARPRYWGTIIKVE